MAATPPGVVVGMAFTGVLLAVPHSRGALIAELRNTARLRAFRPIGLKNGVRGDVGLRTVA